MKSWSIAGLITLTTLFSLTSLADDVEVRPLSDEPSANELVLPTVEKAFVEAINKFNRKSIVDQLGEPAKAEDVRLKGSSKIVASIWHYHNINTDENGVYYPTTELDFIDDKVVQVVFLNNDGTEIEVEGKTYDIQQDAPNKELGDGVPLIELDK
jgi:hypothetical protein